MDIYKQSEVQIDKNTIVGSKKSFSKRPTKQGVKNKFDLTPKDISKMSKKDFIEHLETYLNGFQSAYIPTPYEVADSFNIPFSDLQNYIMDNKEVQAGWNMYTQRWITDFYNTCLNEKITEKHYAVQIANQIFKVADTSKRVPDIRFTLGKDFFINE